MDCKYHTICDEYNPRGAGCRLFPYLCSLRGEYRTMEQKRENEELEKQRLHSILVSAQLKDKRGER